HGQVLLPDGLSVRGAGRDKTWLIKDDRLGEWKPMFSVDCKTGRPFRLSGVTLQGAGRDLQASKISADHIQDQGIVLRGRGGSGVIFGNDLDGVNYGVVFMIEGDAKVATHYPYQDQISETWMWDNRANGKAIAAPQLRQWGGVNIAEFLQQGRDFF